jgi:hypothetical protein
LFLFKKLRMLSLERFSSMAKDFFEGGKGRKRK